MEVTVQPDRDGRSVVAFAGELVHGTEPEIWDRVVRLVDDGQTRLVLDLSQVPFCDSTGLGLMVRIQRLTGLHGGWIRIAAPSRDLRRMLQITNLDRFLPVYDSVAEAIDDNAPAA